MTPTLYETELRKIRAKVHEHRTYSISGQKTSLIPSAVVFALINEAFETGYSLAKKYYTED
jgi:hypothetical protein